MASRLCHNHGVSGGPSETVSIIEAIDWNCPRCRGELPAPLESATACPACGSTFPKQAGAFRFLPPSRQRHFAEFLREYSTVRQKEGRHGEADFYRSLPFHDSTGRYAGAWKIRARSFRCLLEEIVRPSEGDGPLRVVDLGAGNCWLSNRLAARGHRCVAVDLSLDERDGLGCSSRYEEPFLAVQAEFDRLPWADGQFELAVFNASLHYSCGYEKTLEEALRVLVPGGTLAVMDTPLYHDPESGRQMVREREREFRRRFGFPSDSLPMENFLTFQRLEQLGEQLGVRWRLSKPHYGWRWALRPLRARLAGRREPARFLLVWAAKEGKA